MKLARLLKRLALSSLAGILLAWGANELSFHFLGSESARGPQTIELVIASGTAERVRAGQTPPAVPRDLAFVVGDTLVVRNDDVDQHQLGAMFIPAGSSARMKFDRPERTTYDCSFSSENILGVDVQPAVTIVTRFTGALLAGLPLGLLIGLYSLVARPPARAPASQ